MSDPVHGQDAMSRLGASLRRRLEAAGRGAAFDVDAALAELDRLDKLGALLRRTSVHSFGEFEHRVQELSLLARIGELFSRVFDEERLCDALLGLVEESLGADRALLYLYDAVADRFVLRARMGPKLGASQLAVLERIAAEAGAARGPIWLEGDAEAAEGRASLPGPGAALLACPLLALGEMLGLIVVTGCSSGAVSEQQGPALGVVADLSSLALRHARVCEEQRSSQRNLEALVAQRTREVGEARSALSHQDRLAALGKLAATVAHEVNNPMSFLVSNLRRASEYVDELKSAAPSLRALVESAAADLDPGGTRSPLESAASLEELERVLDGVQDFAELIHEAREGTDRVRRVGEELHTYAQGVTGVMTRTNLNRLVETALHVARAEAKAEVVFESRLDLLPRVRCQRHPITQVLLNLIQNAAEVATTVRVTTRAIEGYVEVQVADDGPGLAPGQDGRIFDAYYTTKDGASGVGLSLSREIATAHRGVLEVMSSPEGCTFTLRIPI